MTQTEAQRSGLGLERKKSGNGQSDTACGGITDGASTLSYIVPDNKRGETAL